MCHYIVSTLQSLYGPLFQRRICPWPPASPPPPPATTRPHSTAGRLLCPYTYKWPFSDAVKTLREGLLSALQVSAAADQDQAPPPPPIRILSILFTV